ncbi:nitrate/nitrite transporter NrtS [Candidatus Entotheonella palauensis]|uniref:nitrate/nitrite transporter NrtS n=1 Tax=Candidatus Entotheonella palauensis TaxID=93172 RepID=UPI000B7C8659|nr:nitrate/nitrite transporter NrtS [Candidatus Entotheonella palauensis]
MAIDAHAAQPAPWRKRLAAVFSGQVIRKSIIAAVLVGSLLILLNQGDLLFSGQITGRVIIKSLITPLIPFCVTMLGAFLNSGSSTRPEDLRPGWAAVRRSLIIAAIVGSVIIIVNQGDLIISGNISPLTRFKIGITPCVPFCVSLYGAYLAYRNALASQPPA